MSLFARLLDDAAVFPPGDLPLDRAVPEHLAHRRAEHGALVGPLVVGAGALGDLAPVVAALPPGSLAVAVTTPVSALAEALAAADALTAVRVVAVEVTLSEDMTADEAIGLAGQASDVRVFVELPRDERREPLLAGLARAGLFAKLRTGGLTADAFPREEELASAVVAAVRAGVPFKATAGLHHAVRNTDPGTGFEQHGFLNLLAGTAAARAGEQARDVAQLLAERDPERVVAGVREVDGSVREWFRSFGTCSIAEPVAELAALGLLPKVPA
ncbi:hypothetical protein GCM10009798_07510 [Nocardioides panacihumi]|uniref:Transaldolase n=1 Tax=Nocardioides panacihumi TaxID=400774 RepID=A0ABN2QEX1_9ACTN